MSDVQNTNPQRTPTEFEHPTAANGGGDNRQAATGGGGIQHQPAADARADAPADARGSTFQPAADAD